MTDLPSGTTLHNRKPCGNIAAVALVLATIIGLAYFGVLKNQFVDYDDNTYVFLNPNVTRGVDWQTIEWASTHVNACHWVPLTWLSHALDCQFYGLNPAGHHFTSLLLHTVNVVLLFVWLQRATGSLWRSALVAALFGIHPLRVESVAWVAERKDVLSGCFFMLTLLAYTCYAQRSVLPHAPDGRPALRLRDYWLAFFCFACGLMSKPMLVTLPFVLLLLDYWPLRRINLSFLEPSTFRLQLLPLIREKIPFFILSGVVSAITFLAQEATKANVGTAIGIPFIPRLANALIACTNYLGQTFWPANMAVFYPPQKVSLFQPLVIFGIVLFLAITLVAFLQWAKRPHLTMGWCWFLGVLLPVSGIIQAGDMVQADRFTYLPSIGLFILIVWELGALAVTKPGLRMPALFVATSVILMLGLVTHRQVKVWLSTETLFAHAANVTRDNHVALVTLADFDVKRGRIAEATTNVERVLTIAPGFPRAEYLLATILQMQGKMQEAVPHLERSIGPEVFVPSRARLVLSHMDAGRLAEAEVLLDQLLQGMPNSPEAWLTKAALLKEQGRVTEASELFRKITESYSPSLQDTPLFNYEIAELFALTGQSARAVGFYEKAVAAFPEFTNALNNFAWLLATDPAAETRNGKLAVQYAERACELTQWKQPVFMGTLAAAYAEAGRFDEAVRMAERARDKAKALGAEPVATRNAELLEFYRQGKPYREVVPPK